MARYLVTGPRPVYDVSPGEELRRELSVEEEEDLLAAGRIRVLPEKYRVVGPRPILGAEPGATVEMALRRGQRDHLIEAGHIEPAPSSPRPVKPAKKED